MPEVLAESGDEVAERFLGCRPFTPGRRWRRGGEFRLHGCAQRRRDGRGCNAV